MKREIELLRQTRKNFLKFASGLDEKQLLTIPKGFNNNILWNLGHVWVVQQMLCYKLSGLDLLIPEAVVGPLMKGSAPRADSALPTLSSFQDDFVTIVDRLEEDYAAGTFKTYKSYPTSYGYELASIEDAIQFNNLHEGLHFGYIMALKRAVIVES